MSVTDPEEYDLFARPDGSMVQTHGAKHCKGTQCCLHNPSNHKMATWPIVLREDKNWLCERMCEHGVGHPDPDSVAWLKIRLSEDAGSWMTVHGCCGCCREEKDEA